MTKLSVLVLTLFTSAMVTSTFESKPAMKPQMWADGATITLSRPAIKRTAKINGKEQHHTTQALRGARVEGRLWCSKREMQQAVEQQPQRTNRKATEDTLAKANVKAKKSCSFCSSVM